MAAKRIVAQALLILMPALLRLSLAAVYKVGDSAGWTTIGNIDYKQWAATKTFQVGDVIHCPKTMTAILGCPETMAYHFGLLDNDDCHPELPSNSSLPPRIARQ
ncbi:hypothetical protein ES319_A10G124800v1 [Gossypium barbadense]|uniref:Phytocyanin domain-containing protein n=2 Tax=Gossypium TaxID=3633 RepID=A0A5J5U2N4_GOSBA|nr:hypothetical protein ES319_A10G124800v1 [Gossypium barbadense]TYG98695.1 hypothetical protein ES288_A10G137400v1 [Gossypium darwinii]